MEASSSFIALILVVLAVVLLLGFIIDLISSSETDEKGIVEEVDDNMTDTDKPEPFAKKSRSEYNAIKRKEEAQKKTQEALDFQMKQQALEEGRIGIENKKLGLIETSIQLDAKSVRSLQEAFNVEKEREKVELERMVLGFEENKFEYEKKLAFEELERRAFEVKFELQKQKFAIDTLMMELVQYFYTQFNTLDRQKIQLLMEQEQFNNERMKHDLREIEHRIDVKRDSVTYQLKKLDIKSEELSLEKQRLDLHYEAAELRDWESDLHVTGNQQRLRNDNFNFWEDRILKHYGFSDFQSYFKEWQRMNELATKHGYASIDTFAYEMLTQGKYEELVSSYQELQQSYKGLLSKSTQKK